MEICGFPTKHSLQTKCQYSDANAYLSYAAIWTQICSVLVLYLHFCNVTNEKHPKNITDKRDIKRAGGRTDGRTDRPTDGPTERPNEKDDVYIVFL